jgi:hypothetical protein
MSAIAIAAQCNRSTSRQRMPRSVPNNWPYGVGKCGAADYQAFGACSYLLGGVRGIVVCKLLSLLLALPQLVLALLELRVNLPLVD